MHADDYLFFAPVPSTTNPYQLHPVPHNPPRVRAPFPVEYRHTTWADALRPHAPQHPMELCPGAPSPTDSAPLPVSVITPLTEPCLGASSFVPSDYSSTRTSFLDFSVVWQLDGLIYALKRARLERDACAPSRRASYCEFFGRGLSPLSTACSLFFPALEDVPRVLSTAMAERARGLFIMPTAPFFGPAMFDGRTAYDFLACKSVLSFSLEGQCCRRESPSSGESFAPLIQLRAFLVFFGTKNLAFRTIPGRREKLFSVSAITMPVCLSTTIRDYPFCPDRTSHVAGARRRPDKADAAPAGPPHSSGPCYEPLPRSAIWDATRFNLIAGSYPFKDVADIASEAISIEGFKLDYAGDRGKFVPSTNMFKSEVDEQRVRARLKDEVAAGRMAGPFTHPPFPNPASSNQIRPPPMGCEPKEKYNPASDEFRLVINLSVHRPFSMNDLVWSPMMVGVHLQAIDIMTLLMVLGVAAVVRAYDIKKAYRLQFIHMNDLHLFVYALTESEFYQDLRHPFGSLPSGFCFWCITAIIVWASLFNGVVVGSSRLLHFVDNYFLCSAADDASHDASGDLLFNFLSGLGPALHEEQRGTRFEGLGWEWDTVSQSIKCPELKRCFFLNQMTKYAAVAAHQDWLRLKQVEKLVGTLQWLKTACPSLGALQSSARAAMVSATGRGSQRVECGAGSAVRHALFAAVGFLSRWDGTKRFYIPFTPRYSWLALVRTDASTAFGWGGMAFPMCVGAYAKWTPAECDLSFRRTGPGVQQLEAPSTLTLELLALWKFLLHCKLMAERGFDWSPFSRVQFELDNESAVLCLRKFYSEIPEILLVLEDIRGVIIDLNFVARFEHILRDYNKVSDALSTNSVPQALALFQEEFGQALALEASCL